MDLYNADGALDFEKARQRVRDAEALGDRGTRDDWLRIIGTAALVDVAESLAVISAESAHAIRQHAGEVNDPAPTDADDADRDLFVVGDLVVVKGTTEPGEIVHLGFDQGELYADVAFANGAREKYYVRNLERIIDTPDDGFTDALAVLVAREGDAAEDDADEIPVEDAEPSIDADFDEATDGRAVSTEAEKKAAADAIEDAKKARGKGKKGGK